MSIPWERRPDEGDKAWIAFVAYRDAGPGRTIKAATAATGRPSASHRQLELWSSKFDWVARVRSYESHLDRKTVQPAVEKARAEMAERHVKFGRALQGRAAQGLGNLKPEKMKASEVAALAKAGVDIERVAAGEPTDIQRIALVDEGRSKLRRIFGDDEVKAS